MNDACQFDCADGREDAYMDHCPLFKGLRRSEHDAFLQRHASALMQVAKGSLVVRQHDPIQEMLLLVKGEVSLRVITLDGNVLELERQESVMPMATAFLYAREGQYPFDILALTPCSFLRISKTAWLEEIGRNTTLLQNFLALSADLTANYAGKLQRQSLKSLRHRLALFLLEKSTPEQPVVQLKRSRTQLAEYLGVQRPSLARTLKELETEGLISIEGRRLTIINRPALERSTLVF